MDVQLVMWKEDGERRNFDLKRSVSIIGRAGDCDFQIPLAIISRRHCQISKKDKRVMVKDLGSSNGTYVNNKRVLQTEVHAGDTLTVGPVIFTILIDGKPEEVEPVHTVLTPPAEAKAESTAAEEVPKDAMEGSSLDLASLDNIELADDTNVPDLDDSALPSPLAELEALAKQQKK